MKVAKFGPPRRSLADRFWDKVVVGMECWGWAGATATRGYGKMTSGGWHGKTRTAHRVSWELHYGPILDGLQVLHLCDNPACANPAHLTLGTQLDNMRDMHRKGRAAKRPLSMTPSAQRQRARKVRLRAANV